MEFKGTLTDDAIVPLQAIAIILQASKKTINNYTQKGMPTVPSGKQKAYPVRECLLWAIEQGYFKMPINIDDEVDTEELPARTRKDLADAKIKELEYDIKMDKYVLKDFIVQRGQEIGIVFREGIMSLGDRMAGQLASEEDPQECKVIIDAEARRISEEIHARLIN